jgi:Poly A polymerase head domain
MAGGVRLVVNLDLPSLFFAGSPPKVRAAMLLIQERLQKVPAVLIGGAIRDTLFHRPLKDLDIVAHASLDTLRDAFLDVAVKENTFGGLLLKIHDVPVDLWPLRSTWAFRNDAKFLTRTSSSLKRSDAFWPMARKTRIPGRSSIRSSGSKTVASAAPHVNAELLAHEFFCVLAAFGRPDLDDDAHDPPTLSLLGQDAKLTSRVCTRCRRCIRTR